MNKRLIFIVFSMIISIFLSACGGESPTAPQEQPAEAVAVQPTEVVVVQATEAPVVQPTEVAVVQPAEVVVVQPTEAAVVEPAEIPPTAQPIVSLQERQDIPLTADAVDPSIVAAEGSYVLTYRSANDLDSVVAFYETAMPPHNWSYRAAETTVLSGISAVLYFDKGAEKSTITLTNMGGVTQAVIAVEGASGNPSADSPPAAPTVAATSAPVIEPTTASPTTAPTQPPANSGNAQDIPTTADATNIAIADTADSYTVRYQSATGLDSIVAFYESQMPPRGWTYLSGDSSIVPGVTATLYFTKSGQEATITMTNTGGSVSVEAVVH